MISVIIITFESTTPVKCRSQYLKRPKKTKNLGSPMRSQDRETKQTYLNNTCYVVYTITQYNIMNLMIQ